MFIKDEDTRKFYMEEIEDLLKDYDPGEPKHKPDVLQQTAEIKKNRAEMEQKERARMMGQTILTMRTPDGKEQPLSINDVQKLLNENQQLIIQKDVMIQRLMKENYDLKIKVEDLEKNSESSQDSRFDISPEKSEGSDKIEITETDVNAIN